MRREVSSIPTLARSAVLWVGASVLVACVQAVPTHQRQADSWRTECTGYYAMQLPGASEYGSIEPKRMSPFIGGWGFTLNNAPPWGVLLIPDPRVLSGEAEEKQSLYVSRSTTPEALKSIMDKINRTQEHEKQLILDDASAWQADRKGDPNGEYATHLREKVAALRFYKPVPGLQAIADDDGKRTTFYVYLNNGRILEARRPSLDSPAKTIEAFLQQYSTREFFVLPAGPGVCLPYGFYRGEQVPADIGTTLTLVDQPDIVINLKMWDARDGVDEPRQMLINLLSGQLAGATEVQPLDGKLKPSHTVTIDGHEGLGHFALVRRKVSKPGDKDALDNPYTKDRSDWVYVAYVPGLSGGKPGESFNIQVKIERFGRFAKEPVGKQMTEKQFRAFAKRFVEGIHRRPGSWVAK
jgi:hypothetical protein